MIEKIVTKIKHQSFNNPIMHKSPNSMLKILYTQSKSTIDINSILFESNTCTVDAAVSVPATPPPKTRPSDPARVTFKVHVLLRSPLFSDCCKEPDKDIISKRPYNVNRHHVKRMNIKTDIFNYILIHKCEVITLPLH